MGRNALTQSSLLFESQFLRSGSGAGRDCSHDVNSASGALCSKEGEAWRGLEEEPRKRKKKRDASSLRFFFSFFEIEQRGDGKVSSHFFLFLFRSSSSSA